MADRRVHHRRPSPTSTAPSASRRRRCRRSSRRATTSTTRTSSRRRARSRARSAPTRRPTSPTSGRASSRRRSRRSRRRTRSRRSAAASATRPASRPAGAPTPTARSRSATSSATSWTSSAPRTGLPPVPVTKTQTVGIVGGGPAGLTAAQDLAEAGYAVHVYELTDMLGGYMTWGIPAFRCPPEVFQEDIDRMLARCPGITVHLGIGLGRGVTLDELKERHDAVLLTIGAWWAKGLRIENADDERVRRRRRVPAPRQRRRAARRCRRAVIVVGAGDVAMDACRARPPPARLRGRAGAVPPRPRRDPGAQGRAPRRDRGGHRDRLQRAAGRRATRRTTAASCCAACAPGSASRARTGGASADRRRGLRARLRLRARDPGHRPDARVSEHLDELGLMGRREGAHRLGLDAHGRSEGLRRGRRRLRPLDDRHGHAPRPPRRLLRARQFLEGDRRPAALPHAVQDAARAGRAGRAVGGVPARAPGVPRPGREPGRVPGDRVDLRRRGREARGGALLPLRRRDRLVRLQRAHARGHLRHGAHEARTTRRKQRARLHAAGSTVVDQAHFHPEVASLDDIVFLPANLSRLVIDPYRDACRVATHARRRASSSPRRSWSPASTTRPRRCARRVAHGVAGAGARLRRPAPLGDGRALAAAARRRRGRRRTPARAAVIAAVPRRLPRRWRPSAARDGQLLGLAARTADLPEAIPFALERGLDLLLLEASRRLAGALARARRRARPRRSCATRSGSCAG